MKCDKLIKEAFEGIEFRYKLDDTLEELGNQKLSSKQLEGFLVGKGISPKEIKQSGVLKGFEDDNRVMTGKEWLERSGDQRIVSEDLGVNHYGEVTLGTKGLDNPSYKETGAIIKSPNTNEPSEPHFNVNNQTDGDKSLLGWRRTHTDTINGSKVTVLNELQSDWAQTERAGRGTFESNYTPEYTPAVQKLIKAEGLTKEELSDPDYMKDKIDNWIEEEFISEVEAKTSNKNIVADFPISEVKHTQYQIVGALDEAIKNGTNKVVIPIERENELVGTAGVTKFYDSLNKKILPEIRKKLEKQGMRIKVGKEEYSGDIDYSESFNRFINTELTQEERMDLVYMKDLASNHLETRGVENEDLFNAIEDALNIDDLLKALHPTSTNTLHTLTIEEIPGNKVKWDVYALLGGLGLASQTKSEANTRKVNMGTNDNASEATVKQYFADIESSGGNYKAFNKGSKAYGKYQITPIMMKDLGITMRDLNTPAKQEAIMSKLIPKYQSRLKQFDLPVNKENMFVLHNLGMTGGIRVIKGNPTSEDISNMKNQLHGKPKSTDNEIINNYAITYNLDK